MEILKYNEFCQINESAKTQLEPPYSEIFVSKVDLYQTYYDLKVISEVCGPDYDEKLAETLKPVFAFLEKCCPELEYDLAEDIFITVEGFEKKYDVLSGDAAMNKIAIPLANSLAQKDYAKFDEIRCHARALLVGLGYPYDSTCAAGIFNLTLTSNYKKYVKEVEYPSMSNNELLNGAMGKTWKVLFVNELKSFAEKNKLPAEISTGHEDGENLIFIYVNGKFWMSIEYLGAMKFEIADSVKSLYISPSEKETSYKFMLEFVKRELIKVPTIVKEITANGTEYRLEKENKGNIVTVFWNTTPKVKSMECSEWLKGTGEPGVYKTETEWDELDNAVAALGGKKLGKDKGYVVDDGDGKQQRFRTTYYDFSDVLK